MIVVPMRISSPRVRQDAFAAVSCRKREIDTTGVSSVVIYVSDCWCHRSARRRDLQPGYRLAIVPPVHRQEHLRPPRLRRMVEEPLDEQERWELCDLLFELGPSEPTLLTGWTTHDLAAHLVLREHDLVAAPCLVLPGIFQRFAEQRRAALAHSKDFAWLVAQIRSGPPVGIFRIRWVRSFPNLNEYFVHHEDVRRANGRGPRSLTPAMDDALWRNVGRASRYLSRRLHDCGLEIEWAGTDERVAVRRGEATARLSGHPGELLLYLFGRRDAAQITLNGPPNAVAAILNTHIGM